MRPHPIPFVDAVLFDENCAVLHGRGYGNTAWQMAALLDLLQLVASKGRQVGIVVKQKTRPVYQPLDVFWQLGVKLSKRTGGPIPRPK